MDLGAPGALQLFRPGARLGVRFLLSSATRLCAALEADLTSTLVFAGLLCRNLGDGQRNREEPAQPSMEALTPSSAYAVAKRLRMPYETTRRHLHRLIERGLCVHQAGGLLVPPGVLTSDALQASRQATWAATRELRHDLAALDVKLRPWTENHAPTAMVAVSRLSIGLLIDGTLLARKTLGLDTTSAMTFLAINEANTAARRLGPEGAAGPCDRLTLGQDPVRYPVSVRLVSKALRLPHETARRHAKALVRAGLCERGARGFMVVPIGVLARADLVEGAERAWRMTARFVGDALKEINLDTRRPIKSAELTLAAV